MMLKHVFLLWHTRILDEQEDDSKLIGVYSTDDLAKEKIFEYRRIDGFKDFPDGFEISEYQLDQDHWKEGFSITKKGGHD